MANDLKLHYYGDPILRKVGSIVTNFDAQLADLGKAMVEKAKLWEGCGLAAQQVGLALQLFILDFSYSDRIMQTIVKYDGKQIPFRLINPLIVVNPKMQIISNDMAPQEEGCLSFMSVRCIISRGIEVDMQFQDVTGAAHTLKAEDFIARAIQHEYDHLQGVLFIDRIHTIERRNLMPKLKQIKRGTFVSE